MILGQTTTVKPSDGVHIRKPNGQILSADGETVIVDSYWLRRMNEGDITEVVAESPKAKG